MKIEAKPLVENFWIVEKDGKKIGTLTKEENHYMMNDSSGIRFFDNQTEVEETLGRTFSWKNFQIKESRPRNEVYGYPTTYVPYDTMYDVKRGLPIFTKSPKSESLYCAGYYVIYFNKGWVKSFCPKFITIQKNNAEGPFKTLKEAKQRLNDMRIKRTENQNND